MIKYIELDALMNYLPTAIKDSVDKMQIQSWAYQAYKEYNLPFSEDLKVAIVSVKNHKAFLPQNVKRITGVRLFTGTTTSSLDPSIEKLVKDYEGYRLVVYQEIFFSSDYYKLTRPIYYLGQMRSPLIDEDLYCNNCAIGFSVDKRMSCLTIDVDDSDITLLYYTPVEDEGKLLIPDDPTLMKGLSWYVQSMYWLDSSFGHEANSERNFLLADQRAQQLLTSFGGKRMLAAINPNRHQAMLRLRKDHGVNFKRNRRRLFRH